MACDSSDTSSTHLSYYLLIEQHLLPTTEEDGNIICLYDDKSYRNFEKHISVLIELSELSIVYRDITHLLLSFSSARPHALLETAQTILEIEYQYNINQCLLNGYSFYIMQSTGINHMADSQIVKIMSDRAMWALQINSIGIDSDIRTDLGCAQDVFILNNLCSAPHQQPLTKQEIISYQDFVTIQHDSKQLYKLLNKEDNQHAQKGSVVQPAFMQQRIAEAPENADSVKIAKSTVISDQQSIQLVFYNNSKGYPFYELLSAYASNNHDAHVGDAILQIGDSAMHTAHVNAMLFHAITHKSIERYISHLPTLTQTYARRLHQLCSRILEDGSVAVLEDIQQHMYKLLSYIMLGYATYCRQQSRTPCVVLHYGEWLAKQTFESIVQLCKTASNKLPFTVIVSYPTAPPYLKNIELPHSIYTASYQINKEKILQLVPQHKIATVKKYLDSIIRFNASQYHGLLGILTMGQITINKDTIAEIPPSIRTFYKLLMLLPILPRTMVYVVSLLGHNLYINHVIKFFEHIGYAASTINDALNNLIRLGIIQNNVRCQFHSKEYATFFRTHCIKLYPGLVEKVAHYYYQQWRKHLLPLSINLLRIMSSCKSQRYCKEIVTELMHYYALKKDPHALKQLSEICTEVLQQWNTSPSGLQASQLLLQYINIHLKLYDTSHPNRQQSLDTSYSNEVGSTDERGYYLLAVARHLYYHRQTEQALRTITKSILVFQDSSNDVGLTRSYIEASCYLLSNGKLQDAEHYINIAADLMPNSLPTTDYFRLLGIQTSIVFALGDYSQVLHLSKRYKKDAEYQEWILYVQFLAGRALFELGDYTQATKEFVRGINISRVTSNTMANELFTIWLARTHVYINNFDKAEKLLTTMTARREMLLVMAELYLFQSKYEKSMQYIKRYADLVVDRARSIYEKPDFRNGHIGCSSDHGVMMSRIAQAIQGYLASKLGKFIVAQKTLQHLIHIENISHNDPYLSLYYLYYSEVTRDNATPENIKLRQLLIGRALKCMQECSRMISDSNDRMKYVKHNKWNQKIVRYAEHYNLL